MFKLYGEVNSVKNTAMNMWLNDGVYWQWKYYIKYIIYILHETLLARKLSKPENGRYRPKHVVFRC